VDRSVGISAHQTAVSSRSLNPFTLSTGYASEAPHNKIPDRHLEYRGILIHCGKPQVASETQFRQSRSNR